MSSAAFAQRRHFDPHHIQSIVEIQPEALVAGGAFEVAVGRRDDAHIELHASVPPTRLNDRVVLERAEQLRLNRQAELANLVEEDGAAVGAPRSAPRARSSRP